MIYAGEQALRELGYARTMMCKGFKVENEQKWMFAFYDLDTGSKDYLLVEVLEREGGLVGNILFSYGFSHIKTSKIVDTLMKHCQ
jgi:hypothetical protein